MLNNSENLKKLDSANQTDDEVLKLRQKLSDCDKKIKQLNERIEADRNAIMQIQFEASQHKQEELDLHETYVWRTGLKIEKILQKTGIAFIRSLLVLADYKRMGLLVVLRRGLNEALHRQNVAHSKRKKLKLCTDKFIRYKKSRQNVVENDLTKFSVPQQDGLVSVVLPVYNGGSILRDSIKSVLEQTYTDFELIIVNDGSTDESAEIIEEFAKKDKRIKVINQENKKLPTALSVGFSAAKGEFLTWTSADNIMLSHCLRVLVDNLKRKTQAAMVYGNMRLIDRRGKIKRGHFWFEKPVFSGNVCFPKTARCLNTYANNTIGAAFMYRRKAAYILENYSKFKTNLEDYDYWMRLNSMFKIEHTDEEKPLYLYRIHGDSLTAHDKELGITKNRYKLMVLDDFRRDFYMSSLVWILDTEDENSAVYKDFCQALEKAGHIILTRDEALSCDAAKEYSCFCYAYFGSNPDEQALNEMKRFSGSVLISDKAECKLSENFDMLICTEKYEPLKELDLYRGWFFAESGKAAFDIAESKLKNKILYTLEGMIEEPERYERKISIIICTYMRGEKLIDAIWSVIRQSLSKKEYEIIIVDNAPFTSGIREQVDEFREKYKEYEGFIRYIGVPQKGLSYARNAGMWNAKGEYLTFLDDDVLADYYLLEEIYTAFKYHPNVGIVGGQVILERPFPTPKVLKKGWESLWSQFKISESSFREATQQFEFPYGANYSVKRSAIWRVGGFRMSYGRVGNDFAGGEETALAFKMLQIGYGIGLQPRAKVLHRVDHSRFTTEHVKKTIMAGILTTHRFFLDLHTSVGWTERYVKNQIKITQKEIKILTRKKADELDIYYKKCYLAAYERLLEYMKENQTER
ncbi:MAG: glycosyltransferase [Clostridia bacterium]|nr:glycosyltransferase [Clostridia bacterium]MBR6524134.1 glycosyltransferase [Clostridia bacterium]